LSSISYFKEASPFIAVDMPSENDIEWKQEVLWDSAYNADWIPIKGKKGTEYGDNVNVRVFAKHYDKDMIIMIGIEEDGVYQLDEWLNRAKHELFGMVFGKEWQEDLKKYYIISPKEVGSESKIRLLGKNWVFTSEWDDTPTDGWERFCKDRYNNGGYALFPWGTIGYKPSFNKKEEQLADETNLLVFELHTIEKMKEERDKALFLRGTIIPFIINAVKIIIFMDVRYKEAFKQQLEEKENKIIDAIEKSIDKKEFSRTNGSLKLEELEEFIKESTKMLYEYSKQLIDLTEDVTTIKADYNSMKDILTHHNTKWDGIGFENLLYKEELIIRQMQLDLDYFKLTETLGLRMLSTLQITIDIERARIENKLSNIGLITNILIVVISIGIMLGDTFPIWGRFMFIGFLIIVSIMGYFKRKDE